MLSNFCLINMIKIKSSKYMDFKFRLVDLIKIRFIIFIETIRGLFSITVP